MERMGGAVGGGGRRREMEKRTAPRELAYKLR